MQYVYVRRGDTIDQADAIFTVTGNGMSPIIRDGDEVLIKYTDSLEPGAIGIFMIDGNPCIRQYYPTGLRSFRPDLEQVHLPEDVKYEIVGQFLCVLTPEMRPNAREEAIMCGRVAAEFPRHFMRIDAIVSSDIEPRRATCRHAARSHCAGTLQVLERQRQR